MFTVCGYDLYRRAARKETRISWPMAVTGISLILLATARFILNITYVFLAFIHHGDHRAERIAFFHDLTQPVFIARHCVFLVVQLVGDSFVVRFHCHVIANVAHCHAEQIYRCWVVWGNALWVVIVPIILTVISTGTRIQTILH